MELRLARLALPGEGAGEDDRDPRSAAGGRTRGAGLRAPGHGGDAGEQGRPAPGRRLPHRRDVAHGDGEVGEAEPRAGDPVWDGPICIQCNKCALVCPHAAIRTKVYGEGAVATAPQGFKHMAFKGQAGSAYTVQVAPEDCTGCGLCIEVCPAKDKANPRHKALELTPQPPLREQEKKSFEFFLDLPEVDRTTLRLDVKGSQFLQPLFEFSGACSGCGETPYIKLLTQLFGDRLIISNATGCSSIYGGNLPTTPYAVNREGRGPAWANSLFEDNAEFGFGIRLGSDALRHLAETVLKRQAPVLGDAFVTALLEADQSTESGIAAQRKRVAELKGRLKTDTLEGRTWRGLADHLLKKTVWIVGGDGWAYDIGYGGLDHVLSTDVDVNILVLDTEVYSNTGGQQSKATPLGAAAKFAAAGKSIGKKDLGLLAMSYRTAYVAQVAFGAKDAQMVKAMLEAESYRGPSLVIAYSHCIAHGYDLVNGLEQQKRAVDSATWPLYRFDPRRIAAGQPPLVLDSGPAKIPVREYMREEARFRITETPRPRAVQAAPGLGAAERHPALRRVRAAGQGRRSAGHGHPRRPAAARGQPGVSPHMDLSVEYLGRSWRTRCCRAPRRSRTSWGPSARSRTPGPRPSSCARCSRSSSRRSSCRRSWPPRVTESFSAEASSMLPEPSDYRLGPDRYLEQLRKIRAAVKVPVIASLNGTTPGGWIDFARLIEQAGASALELNLYAVPTDPARDGAAVEQDTLDLVRTLKARIRDPGRGEALALLHLHLQRRPGARGGRGGRAGALQPAVRAGDRRGRAGGEAGAAPLGQLGAAAPTPLAGNPVRAAEDPAGDQRRSPRDGGHHPRADGGGDGGPAGLDACSATAPRGCCRSARRSSAGRWSASTPRFASSGEA